MFKFSAVNLPCPPRYRVAGSELDVLRGAREALRQARTARPSLREFPIVGWIFPAMVSNRYIYIYTYIYVYINLMELNSSYMVFINLHFGEFPIFVPVCFPYGFPYRFPSYKLPWLALSHQAGSDLCDLCHDSCSAHWAVRGGVQ